MHRLFNSLSDKLFHSECSKSVLYRLKIMRPNNPTSTTRLSISTVNIQIFLRKTFCKGRCPRRTRINSISSVVVLCSTLFRNLEIEVRLPECRALPQLRAYETLFPPGRMLELIRQQLLPSDRSFLFLVLPTACTENSRYMTSEHLQALLRVIGFEQVKKRARPGGKVIYTLWKRQEPTVGSQGGTTFKKRIELRGGAKRNNFMVLLD